MKQRYKLYLAGIVLTVMLVNSTALSGHGSSRSPFTPVAGNVSITGNVAISSAGLDFLPLLGGPGNFQVGIDATGSFSGLTFTTGTVKDLPSASTPVGMAISVTQFLSFFANPLSSST